MSYVGQFWIPELYAIAADEAVIAIMTIPTEGRAKLAEAGFFEALAPNAEYL